MTQTPITLVPATTFSAKNRSVEHQKKAKSEPDFNTKVLINATTAIGMTLPLLIQKRNILKESPFKKLHQIFKITTTKEILSAANGALSGGLIGGLIQGDDKDSKIKEAAFQFLNVNVVALAVCKITHLLEKKSMALKVPAIALAMVGGLKAVELFTNKIFKKQEEPKRQVKVTDYLMHIDDVAVAVAASGTPVLEKYGLCWGLPFLFQYFGYKIGTAQKHEHHH